MGANYYWSALLPFLRLRGLFTHRIVTTLFAASSPPFAPFWSSAEALVEEMAVEDGALLIPSFSLLP